MTPIDPRAIEAAARAEYEHTEGDTWDQACPKDRADWLDSARVALEAAQGIMWAQALRDIARLYESDHPSPSPTTFYDHPQTPADVARVLRGGADYIDPQ